MDPATVRIISRARQEELEAQIARRLRARESGTVVPRVSLGRRLATLALILIGR